MTTQANNSGTENPGLVPAAQGFIRLKVRLGALEQTAQALWAVPDILSVSVQTHLHELALVTKAVAFERWVDIVESVVDQAGQGIEKVKSISWNCAPFQLPNRAPLPA